MKVLRPGLGLISACVIAATSAFHPLPAAAGDLVMPLHYGGAVNSWFDHDGVFNCLASCSSSDKMILYDGSTYSNAVSNLNNCTLGVNCYDGHDGIDFQANLQTPVYAVSDGTVTLAKFDSTAGYEVEISHPLLGYSSYYIHLYSYSVAVGDQIYKGQQIALSGCTGGGCLAPHLHFGIFDGSGRQIDPFGWSGTGNDPYTPGQALGYLWATRFGLSDGSTSLFVGEPWLTSQTTTEVNNGITQSAIWGPRIGVLQNGALSVKDGKLNASWQPEATSVSQFAIAGRRILAEFNDGTVYAKEGDLGATWQREADLDGSSTLYATPSRIGGLVGYSLKVKEGLGDAAVTEANPVANASLARQRIAVTFTDGTVYYKDGGLGATWSAPLYSGASSVYLGGSRICILVALTAKCQEEAPYSSLGWIVLYSSTYCIQLNDTRFAVCDSSTGYLKANEGALTRLGAWTTMSTTLSSILLN